MLRGVMAVLEIVSTGIVGFDYLLPQHATVVSFDFGRQTGDLATVEVEDGGIGGSTAATSAAASISAQDGAGDTGYADRQHEPAVRTAGPQAFSHRNQAAAAGGSDVAIHQPIGSQTALGPTV